MLCEPAVASGGGADEPWGAARTWRLPHGAAQGDVAACLALRCARGRQAVVAETLTDGLGTFAVVAGSHGGASRRPAGTRRAAAPRWTR
jgi:hypothetical protein